MTIAAPRFHVLHMGSVGLAVSVLSPPAVRLFSVIGVQLIADIDHVPILGYLY